MLGKVPTQSGGGMPIGERKVATVMFADMARSSRLIFGHDPEEAEEWLLALLQLMVDSVHRYGGTVNQVLGDGVMALFGVPDAQEDHALRACLAADSLHRSMAKFMGKVPTSEVPEIAARVGISSGELVVTDVGRQFGLKFRAVGEAVYQAQRMEATAPPGVRTVRST